MFVGRVWYVFRTFLVCFGSRNGEKVFLNAEKKPFLNAELVFIEVHFDISASLDSDYNFKNMKMTTPLQPWAENEFFVYRNHENKRGKHQAQRLKTFGRNRIEVRVKIPTI